VTLVARLPFLGRIVLTVAARGGRRGVTAGGGAAAAAVAALSARQPINALEMPMTIRTCENCFIPSP
jgi:hypothetical protein